MQKGDVVWLTAHAYYPQRAPASSFAFSLGAFVASLLSTQPPAGGGDGGGRPRALPLLSIGLAAGLPSLAQLSGGVPKGYARILVFDQDSNLVASQTRQLSAAACRGWERLVVSLAVPQDGYVTAYVGNESDADVFFDDVQVDHAPGLQVQQTDYDPAGLALTGRATSSPGLRELNRYQFNGQEFQPDLGLNWNHQDARFFDPQLLRWHVVDPLAEVEQESWSPYQFGFDNAVRFNDPDGRIIPVLAAAVAGAAIGVTVDYAFQVGINHFYGGLSWGEASSIKNINTSSLKISAGAGALTSGLGAMGAAIARSAAIGIGAKTALSVGITASEGGVLAAESIAKQSTDSQNNGSVSAGQVATDVAVGMAVGGMTGPRLINTGPLARTASRAERIAANSPRLGRTIQAQSARGALRSANAANAAREVAGGFKSEVTENAGQATAAAAQGGNNTSRMDLNLRPSIAPADNTRTVLKRF